LSSIRGPYAFVFYDAVHRRVYYGRDCLGRRSLLRKTTQDNSLVLSSVCDNASGDTWAEVEADGIYVVDLDNEMSEPQITHIPHVRLGQTDAPDLCFVGRFPPSRCRLIVSDSTLSFHEPHNIRAMS
jgi:asparagine synthetase B (glutamine-hydrolysing)